MKHNYMKPQRTVRTVLLSVLLGTVMLFTLLLSGCAANVYSKENMPGNGYGVSNDYGYGMEGIPQFDASEKNVSGESAPQNDLAMRKIIKTVRMTMETVAFDAFEAGLKESLAAAGGYVENATVSGGGRYNDLRAATYTLRIPADGLEAFRAQLGTLATVSYEAEGIEDITLTYVDMESRVIALETERDSLLRLLEKAETVEEIITVQSRLSDVNYQIESYRSQLRVYDSLISYSTVTLTVNEADRISVVEEASVGARIRQQFAGNLSDIGEGFVNFFVWFVSNLPYLLLFGALFVALPVLLIVGCVKRARKKRRARTAAQMNPQKPQ